jgi:two-component system chemotaxis response regulator CheB
VRSTAADPVRVFVVEDSPVQHAHLVRTLECDGDISVVGHAVGAAEAVAEVERLRPDVITMDLQIPGGGGQHAIEQIMAHTPTPILVLSGRVTNRQSTAAVEALLAGAVDALPKPDHWTPQAEAAMRTTVRSLRGVTVIRHPRGRLNPAPRSATNAAATGRPGRIVAIAASTGGPAALATVLSGLSGLAAPVLVVQHMHPDFVDGLVTWMERASALPVQLASHGVALRAGVVYIGPGDTHLKVDGNLRIVLDPEPATRHRPSADELFGSVAARCGPAGIGVVLTGMGDDGTAGLLALRARGGLTIAQDEASCAVFGMPRAARQAGAVATVVPVDGIAAAILRGAKGQPG